MLNNKTSNKKQQPTYKILWLLFTLYSAARRAYIHCSTASLQTFHSVFPV